MKQMLDIVMPHYNEPWETGRPFFDMLACQKGIDFRQIRVLLIHDGPYQFQKDMFDRYPYRVEQYAIEHKGVSSARNKGLNLARAKWVTFCDFDDTFSSIYSLKFVFDVLYTEKHDLLWNPFFVENITGNGKLILTANESWNGVWVHNKYFRTKWLKELGLRFNESLSISEDSAFLAILGTMTDISRIGKINSPFPLYVWCYREGSATTDKANTYKNMVGQFFRNMYVSEQFRESKNADADAMIARTMTDAYISLTRKELPDGCDEMTKLVADFWKKNKAKVRNVSAEQLQRVMKASIKEGKDNGWLNDDRPKFADWLKGLDNV